MKIPMPSEPMSKICVVRLAISPVVTVVMLMCLMIQVTEPIASVTTSLHWKISPGTLVATLKRAVPILVSLEKLVKMLVRSAKLIEVKIFQSPRNICGTPRIQPVHCFLTSLPKRPLAVPITKSAASYSVYPSKLIVGLDLSPKTSPES